MMMTLQALHQRITAIVLAFITAMTVASTATAQNSVEAVITVNDQAITQYEIDQRARMLSLFRAPGDTRKLARQQLIDDRIKLDAAHANGIVIEQPDIQDGMEEFAGRNNMNAEEFVSALESSGVSEASFRDFVRAGVTWREVTRARFASNVSVSADDLNRAKNTASSRSGVRVLLSEIIMVAPPPQVETVMAQAEKLSAIRSTAEFSAAARRYSAAATKVKGGQLDWMALSDLPAPLRSVILSLSPGEVSDPLPLDGAIALFQLRDIEETSRPDPQYAAIEYAIYYIAGGNSDAAQKTAADIRTRVDNCDDLYGIAHGQPEEVLQRESQAPDKIPANIRYELAKLDDGEVSSTLVSPDGQALMFIMMCGRTPVLPEDAPSDEELTNFIRNQRIDAYAEGYLEQLRSEARIVEK